MSGQELSSSAVAAPHPPLTFYPKRKLWVVFFLPLYSLASDLTPISKMRLSGFCLKSCKRMSRWLPVLPATLNFKHKYGSLTRSVNRTEGDKLRLGVTLEIPSRFITMAEKDSFNNCLDTLYDQLEFSLYGESHAL